MDTPTPPSDNPLPPNRPFSRPEQLGEVEGVFGWIMALLRKPASVADNLINESGPSGTKIFLIVFVICHIAYGLIMGLFSGDSQMYLVPLKFTLGTAVCALLCYPSLFIFACLSGVDVAPGKVFSILVGGLAMCSLLLVGFLPISFIFTFSVKSAIFMGFVHLLVWAVSVAFACGYIRKGLLLGVPQGNNFLYIWNIVLVLTLLQMSTTLRPLLGPQPKEQAPITSEKKFFLQHWAECLEQRTYQENYDQAPQDVTPEVRE